MFNLAVDYIQRVHTKIGSLPNTYFYCEYLEKPRHNVLSYARTPTNNLVLFDVLTPGGQFLGKDLGTLKEYADLLGIDCIPILHQGAASVDLIKELLTTPSYLGNQTIEGVVVKNYDQYINLYGHIFPVFAKYVREAFKELHKAEWSEKHTTKQSIDLFIQAFRSPARWQKAIIHAREDGVLNQEPKDIGLLVKYIHQDIVEEEKQEIKDQVYRIIIEDIKKTAVSGFPEYYKQQLLEALETSGS